MVFVPDRGSQTLVAPSTSPGCACLPSPSAGLAVCALGRMHPAEIPQGFIPPGMKRKGQGRLPLPTAKEVAEKPSQPWLERPRGLLHLGPRLGCRSPQACRRAALVGLPWRGTTVPKDPVCARFRLSPGFAVRCSRAGWRALVPPRHTEQGPRRQGEGGLVFRTTSAPLRVVAVFILQDEAKEHDRERYHETWPFFFGLKEGC